MFYKVVIQSKTVNENVYVTQTNPTKAISDAIKSLGVKYSDVVHVYCYKLED